MIEMIKKEQERKEARTLEEYIEQMEESEKKKIFDYLKEREKISLQRSEERNTIIKKK